MSIQRENILSLIGKGRYHSCIITSFSFDFYFFEMKAVRWLRSCGIRNINVFIDGNIYSELMKQSIGDEMSYNPGYALYPIFSKGIFHPKVWLLFGKTEGLLIVGSGNLTNSGLGGNDEIWGAFHFDIKNTNNQQIFQAAWQYISKFTNKASGFINEKTTKWIYDYSPWLKEFNVIEPYSIFQLDKNKEIAFLYNAVDTTIWQQLLKVVGNYEITQVTAISPFYDIQGKSIQTLKNTWQDAKVNIVLDEDGLLPIHLATTDNTLLYDWKAIEIGESRKSRLHAKILHLKTSDGIEFCLFGSANITPEGLGLKGINHYNEEASVLIKDSKGGLLKELGLILQNIPTCELSDFNIEKQSPDLNYIIKENKHLIRLLFAEKDYESVSLYSEKEFSGECKIQLYNTFNQVVETLNTNLFEKSQTLKISDNSIHTIQIYDKNEVQAISNKILIHDYFILSKTNPDPRAEDIEAIVNEIHTGELHKVVDLLQYAIHDDAETELIREQLRQNIKAKEASEEDNTATLETKDLSEYKVLDVNQVLHHKSVLLSPSLRILDVLAKINSGELSKFTDKGIREDEQIEDISQTDGDEEEDIQLHKEKSGNQLKSEKKKLHNYLKKLSQYFDYLLYHNEKPKDYQVTLTDLTKFVIALELIYEYGGKVESYTEEKEIHYIRFLPNSINSNYKFDDVKGYLINIVGAFQYLALKGFKKYEFDYTNQKLEHLKKDALVLSLFLVFNQKWKDKELQYLELFILNAFYSFDKKANSVHEFIDNELNDKLLEREMLSKHLQKAYKSNLEIYYEKTKNIHKTIMHNRISGNYVNKALKGDTIFISNFGYTKVYSVIKDSIGNKLEILRPGFRWNNKKSEYVFNSKVILNKINRS